VFAIDAFLNSPVAMHPAAGASRNQKVHVIATFTLADGRSCQVVEQSVFITGQRVRATGTVCQQDDGGWALQR
jgi:surface antigen